MEEKADSVGGKSSRFRASQQTEEECLFAERREIVQEVG